MSYDRLIFRAHAIRRMFEREISVEDVRHVLRFGEVIEDYPDDKPYPSRLILGWCVARPLHIVAAENRSAKTIIIVTVYDPLSNHWRSDFKRRNKS